MAIHLLFLLRRYSPLMFPSVMIFPVNGVHLNPDQTFVCNDTNCTVVLDQLERKSTGSYRCEISGDAPEFHVVHETANMTVAGKRKLYKSNVTYIDGHQRGWWNCVYPPTPDHSQL